VSKSHEGGSALPAGEISKFWQELQAVHVQLLEEHGPEAIKRQQALRYFTWRWSWGNLRRSEQFRFLLRGCRENLT